MPIPSDRRIDNTDSNSTNPYQFMELKKFMILRIMIIKMKRMK
jgi:hypothetical protein